GDKNNFGVRAGFSYKLAARRPVFRGAYGIFYDRPFDNPWQNLPNNPTQIETVPVDQIGVNYLQPAENVINDPSAIRADFPDMLLYQPGIRDPYTQSYFAGFSSTFHDYWAWEANALGSLGRKLITTDQINRPASLPASTANPTGRLNP